VKSWHQGPKCPACTEPLLAEAIAAQDYYWQKSAVSKQKNDTADRWALVAKLTFLPACLLLVVAAFYPPLVAPAFILVAVTFPLTLWDFHKTNQFGDAVNNKRAA
jgi:Flp pilus assembly protein TadB